MVSKKFEDFSVKVYAKKLKNHVITDYSSLRLVEWEMLMDRNLEMKESFEALAVFQAG